ncbi:NADH-quinone oxidoreductase subunit J [bacterium]|jgi:NADH-quinone oxidoreductase subunit J|nr:NADH-quinone oxidoreductase subunit J [bacterium]
MDYSFVAFSAFSTIAILGALLVVLKRNPVASAFALITVFFAFAGLFALMSAHLIAALQILVYTGAIMVLFVFVIMLLSQDTPVRDFQATGSLYKGVAGAVSLAVTWLLVRVVLKAAAPAMPGPFSDEKIREAGGNVKVISEMLFSDHLFHFELTSFLLLGAIVCTIALAKRKVLARHSKPHGGVAQ